MIKGSLMRLGDKRHANIKFVNGSKQLSLSIDNGPSCHTDVLYRADLRCFNGEEDVTAAVFSCGKLDVVRGNVENMARAMSWLQLASSPFSSV